MKGNCSSLLFSCDNESETQHEGPGGSSRDASASAWVKPAACQGEGAWTRHFTPAPVGLLVALTHPQWDMRLSDRLSTSAHAPQGLSLLLTWEQVCKDSPKPRHLWSCCFIPDQLHFPAMGAFGHVKISFSFCIPS